VSHASTLRQKDAVAVECRTELLHREHSQIHPFPTKRRPPGRGSALPTPSEMPLAPWAPMSLLHQGERRWGGGAPRRCYPRARAHRQHGSPTAASSKILLNGIPGLCICHVRGLRQGDPLSPFLFVIAIEALNSLFQLADSWGVLISLRAPAIRYRLSLYADDLVIFVTPSEQDLYCVRAMLQAFAKSFGLCSNISKSQVTPIQCTVELIQLVQLHLPCQLVHFPFRCLGVLLSAFQLKLCDLQPLVDVVADRLSSWKAGMLSCLGRTSLIKSTMSAIPLHISIAVKLCPSTLRDIEWIR
jgi:hypothetical protein